MYRIQASGHRLGLFIKVLVDFELAICYLVTDDFGDLVETTICEAVVG